MLSRRTFIETGLAGLLLPGLIGGGCSGNDPSDTKNALWRIYAMEYGRSSKFRRSVLVRGASRNIQVDLSWMTWLLVSSKLNRRILVDTGFDDDGLQKSWRFIRHRRESPVDRL